MSFASVVFVAAVAALGVAAVMLFLRRRSNAGGEVRDPGLALIEFGQAFPHDPIRDVVMTEDGRTAFLRLADGKVGVARTMGSRTTTHLISPGGASVDEPQGDRGLVIRFGDAAAGSDGVYVFTRPQDAAEVSMWLCGTFVAKAAEGEP